MTERRQEYLHFWKCNQPHGHFSQWDKNGFTINDVYYNCAEQYMMSMKALLFKDEATYKDIMSSNNPYEHQSLGKLVKNFRADKWDLHKELFVYHANLAKYSQNDRLRNNIIATGDKILVEATPRDRIWGIGISMDHPDANNPEKWPGQNLLGKALMKTRDWIVQNPGKQWDKFPTE